VQRTLVPSLVWGDSTCPGAHKPMPHNYCTGTLEPGAAVTEAHAPRACAPQQEATRESLPLTTTRESRSTAAKPQHRMNISSLHIMLANRTICVNE